MKSAIIFPLVVFAEETRAKTGLEAERDYSGMLFANKLKNVINQINVMWIALKDYDSYEPPDSYYYDGQGYVQTHARVLCF